VKSRDAEIARLRNELEEARAVLAGNWRNIERLRAACERSCEVLNEITEGEERGNTSYDWFEVLDQVNLALEPAAAEKGG